MTEPHKEDLEGFSRGSAGTFELDRSLSESWTSLVKNPQERARMSAILLEVEPNLTQEFLDEFFEESAMFRVEQKASGTSGVDIAIMVTAWVASEVVLGALKDMAKAKVKELFGRLWTEVVKPAFKDDLPQSDSLGRTAKLPKDGE